MLTVFQCFIFLKVCSILHELCAKNVMPEVLIFPPSTKLSTSIFEYVKIRIKPLYKSILLNRIARIKYLNLHILQIKYFLATNDL